MIITIMDLDARHRETLSTLIIVTSKIQWLIISNDAWLVMHP
jgi:hypothetical protein